MADRPLTVEPMPDEDEGHTCIYVKDEEDRNFKYCIYCGHTEYRTDEEVLGQHVREGRLHGHGRGNRTTGS